MTSNSAARWESLLTPTSRSFRVTISTLSAAPTCSTTRRSVQSPGSSNVRRNTPVGLRSGGCGGRSSQGICTFVYCGRSGKPCIVHTPGTVISSQAPAGSSSARGRSWNCHRPSSSRRSGWGTACMGRRSRDVSSGASQGVTIGRRATPRSASWATRSVYCRNAESAGSSLPLVVAATWQSGPGRPSTIWIPVLVGAHPAHRARGHPSMRRTPVPR